MSPSKARAAAIVNKEAARVATDVGACWLHETSKSTLWHTMAHYDTSAHRSGSTSRSSSQHWSCQAAWNMQHGVSQEIVVLNIGNTMCLLDQVEAYLARYAIMCAGRRCTAWWKVVVIKCEGRYAHTCTIFVPSLEVEGAASTSIFDVEMLYQVADK